MPFPAPQNIFTLVGQTIIVVIVLLLFCVSLQYSLFDQFKYKSEIFRIGSLIALNTILFVGRMEVATRIVQNEHYLNICKYMFLVPVVVLLLADAKFFTSNNESVKKIVFIISVLYFVVLGVIWEDFRYRGYIYYLNRLILVVLIGITYYAGFKKYIKRTEI